MPESELGGAAPPKPDDPVELGRRAWQDIKSNGRTLWGDWLRVGNALLAGRRLVMEKAKIKKPSGRKYAEMFGHWLQMAGFAEIDKADRAKLLIMMERLDDVEAWRERLTESQRAALNHPSSMWRAFTCPNRGNRGKPKASEQAEPRIIDADTLEAKADELDEKQRLANWHRGLHMRARRAIGDADLEGHWSLDEPPDAGLVSVVRQAAEAWTQLADYLEEFSKLSADEIAERRAGYAESQTKIAENDERKKARWRQKIHQAMEIA